jgi:23S rRNA (uridine2552-2'-O)-methyltransferase
VVDLGCWPGGWLQVAAEAVGPSGRVVGIDLDPIEPALPNENVVAFQGDVSEAHVETRLLAELGGPADVVLCDAAPKLTGVRAADRAHEEALLESVGALVPRLLRAGGTFVAKLLDAPEARDFVTALRSRFASTRVTKVKATRQGSSEKYLIAKDFIG